MNTGALRQIATLDVPAGAAGYTPLDPPTWPCAVLAGETGGPLVLRGRYRPDLTTATRVHVLGRTWHVDTLDDRDGRHVEVVITCREVFE